MSSKCHQCVWRENIKTVHLSFLHYSANHRLKHKWLTDPAEPLRRPQLEKCPRPNSYTESKWQRICTEGNLVIHILIQNLQTQVTIPLRGFRKKQLYGKSFLIWLGLTVWRQCDHKWKKIINSRRRRKLRVDFIGSTMAGWICWEWYIHLSIISYFTIPIIAFSIGGCCWW